MRGSTEKNGEAVESESDSTEVRLFKQISVNCQWPVQRLSIGVREGIISGSWMIAMAALQRKKADGGPPSSIAQGSVIIDTEVGACQSRVGHWPIGATSRSSFKRNV